MANRAYLYALSNQPTSYADRPETITGLSEWAWQTPFIYYVLLSGNPRLCASLISDGLDDDLPDEKTRLYALTGDFAQGFARFERFCAIARLVAEQSSSNLIEALDETKDFLQQHQDRFLLLETIELDIMDSSEQSALQACAETHLANALAAGEAIDALSSTDTFAAKQLIDAIKTGEGKLAPFRNLDLTDAFDNAEIEQPIGLTNWSTVLYFDLWNQEQYEEYFGSEQR